MTQTLEDLNETYPRDDQETKRYIGKFLFERPARWVPRREIVEQFDIDESGVSRHIDDLYEDEFIQSTKEDGERHVQWKGRGAGGLDYWLRQIIPSQMWAAGNELRPLLTVERLGGAYLPTILFGILFLVGVVTALFAIVVTYLPSKSALGFTATDLVIITGALTIAASLSLVLGLLGRLLEISFHRLYRWVLAKFQ